MDDTTDELLNGVIDRNAVCLRQLLALLRPLCLREVRSRLGRAPPDAADILDEAESLLYEWSVEGDPRRHLPRGEPLGKLAWRLIHEVLRRRWRDKKRHRTIAEDAAAGADFPREAPAAAAGFGIERIARLIFALPPADAQTLMAELRHQLGEGPTVAAALSIRPGSAAVRVFRARQAAARPSRTRAHRR